MTDRGRLLHRLTGSAGLPRTAPSLARDAVSHAATHLSVGLPPRSPGANCIMRETGSRHHGYKLVVQFQKSRKVPSEFTGLPRVR